VLLLFALPIFVLVGALVLAVDGRPVFYCGTRLGLGRRPFRMYKFRTLAPNANTVTGGQLLSHHHRVTIRFGDFLRETRLDELPQLLNIALGHMVFWGPRPERPEVVETLCSEIADYERRFSVRPGLIGCSQLFTPHSTPKRIRAFLDNRLAGSDAAVFLSLWFAVYTATVVVRKVLARVVRFVRKALVRPARKTSYRQRRALKRVSPRGAEATLVLEGESPGGEDTVRASILDMNEQALLVRCHKEIRASLKRVELCIRIHRGRGRAQTRRAVCTGRVMQTRRGADYVVGYEPITPLSSYVVDQYFLGKSLAAPFRAWSAAGDASLPS
jgi:lipopolysaccharide/colanic/teichoic acid biosynthesis glycosyltransferase